MTGRVEGKVAFITGGSLGPRTQSCCDVGSRGGGHHRRRHPRGDRRQRPVPPARHRGRPGTDGRRVEALDRRILATRADVRDFAALQQVLDACIAEFGRIDSIVANAGIFPHGSLLHEVDEREWDEIFDINLKGAWLTCKAAIPHLIKQGDGGSITLINSTAGLKGIPTVGPYTASKHGLVGLMRTLALELAPHWIRVNSIHPTAVATDMVFNERTYRSFRPDLDNPTRETMAETLTSFHALPVPGCIRSTSATRCCSSRPTRRGTSRVASSRSTRDSPSSDEHTRRSTPSSPRSATDGVVPRVLHQRRARVEQIEPAALRVLL